MTFLNPAFLWGLLALSIPIIIHFFNFRRVKKINFSNISLLKTVNTKAKSFLRLKHWLVLASRLLFIASLVLAFAQPFLDSKSGKKINGSAVNSFYVDNSFSMQNEGEGKRLLDVALNKLEKLANALPKNSNNQLINNDFASEEFSILKSKPLKDQATKIELSPTYRSLETVFRRQKNLANKQNNLGGNTFFMFSDFQKSTVGNLAKLNLDSTSKLYLIPHKSDEQRNIFIDSVWLDTPFIRKTQMNGLNVKIFNNGNTAVKSLPLKFYLRENQVASVPTNINANGSAVAHFDFSLNTNSPVKGKVTFEDSPISFDNEYYFVLNNSPAIKIIHLSDNNIGNSFVKKVFSNDSLFDFKSFPIQNFDIGKLDNFELLVIEGVSMFSEGNKKMINTFLEKGGHVCIVPDATANATSYAPLLNSLGIRNISRNNNENKAIELAEPNKADVFFKDIFENTKEKEKIGMPQTSLLLNWAHNGTNLLKTKGGTPFLSKSNSNNGQVFLFASPLNDNFGNFAKTALFVPIMYKIAASSVKSGPLAYRFDQNVINIEKKQGSEKTLYKFKNGNFEMIPVQRFTNNMLYLELPKQSELASNQAIKPGFYELLENNKTDRIMAFNHSNQESKLEGYSAAELKSIFANKKNIEILDQNNPAEFVAEYTKLNTGTALWKYFVIAALLFLAIEVALLRFMKG